MIKKTKKINLHLIAIIIYITIAVVFWTAMVVKTARSDDVYRDPQGRIVYTIHRTGDRVVVRDNRGRIISRGKQLNPSTSVKK